MMTHKYTITGMSCGGCIAKVKSALLAVPGIVNADVSLPSQATITMQKHISTAVLQETISQKGQFVIAEDAEEHSHHSMETSDDKGWLQTYKPLIIIAIFITGVSFSTTFNAGKLDGVLWMNNFMAGFFITFSFFKLLDLQGFADSYATYDLLAKKQKGYGFVYPFIELALGVSYLMEFNPLVTNMATILVMGFSSIGALQSVLNKRKIRCACLGAVFNLPMSTVTIVEDLLMVGMAVMMIVI